MANPGDLDTSFSGDGKKTIDFGGTDAANVVLAQPNGRIVLAGGGAASPSFCVARLRPDGALDASFGSGGKRTVEFGGDVIESAYGATLQADGKILLVGESDSRVAVARLNPNGSLDDDFSTDGKRTFQLGRDQHRHGRARDAERQDPGRRILRARGREHPGRAPGGGRRAGRGLRHRRPGSRRLRRR
jgi:uncharacterized delta-60 repeat protein